MPLIWERYDGISALGATGTHINTQVFHNEEDTDNFQSANVVIVDGILTTIMDTDDLCGLRLLIAPEELVDADLTEDIPQPHNRMVYYSWFLGRGPMVFRLRSKRTIPPEYKLWVQTWKATTGGGSTSTALRWGLHLGLVLKH